MRTGLVLLSGMLIGVMTACSQEDPAPPAPQTPAIPSRYAHVTAPLIEVPESLDGERWRQHWIDDIGPYWTMPEAVGSPEGNFPTFRGMDGTIQGPSERRPRMIARQTFAYAVGFMLTGDARLAQLSRAGAYWLLEHAKDDARGGFHARLDASGNPLGNDPKTAQDTAYCAMGLAAYYFISRDPAVEPAIIETRDLLFSDAFWDADNRRIKDAMDADLEQEIDVDNDNGWELVALLDPINAFMLLSQPVLSTQERRDQFLQDLQRLAESMIEHFYQDGFFWGVSTHLGRYNTRHTDFGHALKSYWMVLQIDKRLPGNPFYDLVQDNIHRQVERALDTTGFRWNQRPTSSRLVQRGSDWWVYAEADQLTATLNLMDYRYTDTLAETQETWLDVFVDVGDFKEVIPQINRSGFRASGWGPTDLAKCNQWKNGYHSSEHALIAYVSGQNLAGASFTLHFAVPDDQADDFIARPYIFNGEEVQRTLQDTVDLGGTSHRTVAVEFDKLY